MATKLRKNNNTFLTVDEILTLLNNAGGVTYDTLGGTENYFQVPNADGELIDSLLFFSNDELVWNPVGAANYQSSYVLFNKPLGYFEVAIADANTFYDFFFSLLDGLTIDAPITLDTNDLNITSLPTSSAGLSAGDVWNFNNVLAIGATPPALAFYDALGGTENYFQVPNTNGELVDSKLKVITDGLRFDNTSDWTYFKPFSDARNVMWHNKFLDTNYDWSELRINIGVGETPPCYIYGFYELDNTNEFPLLFLHTYSDEEISMEICNDQTGSKYIRFITPRFKISGIPTSSVGLSAGDVWNDAGTLKIV